MRLFIQPVSQVRLLVLALLGCLSTGSVNAAQYIDHGEYRIHFTTFSSLIIPAEVASAHGIVRSKNRIVINLSVLRNGKPADARISGNVTNLLNQQFELGFEEINEAEAIYYLASHIALERDILRFSLEVELDTGELSPVSLPIEFVRRYD